MTMQAGIFRSKTSVVLWLTLIAFFAFQFILRLTPGILREEIMLKYGVDTVQFGNLSAYYYLGYAGMQIPIGFMLDRYNVKLVSFCSIFVTAVGALISANSVNWDIILIGRLLVGMGSASGFLSVAKVSTAYFHEDHKSRLLGLAFTFGLMGAVVGGQPTKELFNLTGVSGGMNILGGICILIGVFVLLIRPDNTSAKINTQSVNIGDVFTTLCNPVVIYSGICGGLMVGSLEGFADVWSISYFQQIYGFSVHESINSTFTLYIGMCAGGPVLAYCGDKIKSPNIIIFITGILVAAIFLLFFTIDNPSFFVISVIMFILGILCSYQVLVFTTVSDLVSKKISGLAIAIINCINMSFGYLFHGVISYLIQTNWSGASSANNTPLYDQGTFVYSLAIIPILCLIGATGFLLLRPIAKLFSGATRSNWEQGVSMTERS